MDFNRKILTSGIALLFHILGVYTLNGQKNDSLLNGLNIEAKVHYGFVYPHDSEIKYLLNGNISGAEISLSTCSNGRHPWEGLFRFPVYGIAYNYNSFHNPDVLGSAHAVFGYFESPLYRTEKKFKVGYQIGFGVSFVTEHFDPYENPLNLAMSSMVNIYGSLDITARYKITEKNEVKAALELSHYSNGKTKSPNMGINTVTVSAAWVYSLKTKKEVPYKPEPFEYRKHFPELVFNIGGKRDDLLNEKVYKVASFVGDYNYSFTPKYAAGVGFDLLYDESIAITHAFKGFQKKEPDNNDNFQAGLHLGLRARYGNFHVIGHVGYYVYAQFLKYTKLYSRFGFRYALTDHILFNFSVKAHYAIADYLEWGIGYRF